MANYVVFCASSYAIPGSGADSTIAVVSATVTASLIFFFSAEKMQKENTSCFITGGK